MLKKNLQRSIWIGACALGASCSGSGVGAPRYPSTLEDVPPPQAQPAATPAPTPAPGIRPLTPVSATQTPIVSAPLPPAPPPAPPTLSYQVQQGDTLFGVSRRFGVPVAALESSNGMNSPALKVGQKLNLPAGAADKGLDEHAKGPVSQVIPALTPMATRPAPVVTATAAPAPQPIPSSTPAKPEAADAAAAFPGDAEISRLAQNRFEWPVQGELISGFGLLGPGLRNDGINLLAPTGTSVRAAASGEVVYAGDQIREFGNIILIKHDGNWVTAYAHLSKIDVKMKTHVAQGQIIGEVGKTGSVDRPQLHFEVRYAPGQGSPSRPVDPKLVLP